MPHVIAWCGFLGAWLLVAGPLDQAVREIDDQEFRHESLVEAKAQVDEPELGSTLIRARHRIRRPAVEA